MNRIRKETRSVLLLPFGHPNPIISIIIFPQIDRISNSSANRILNLAASKQNQPHATEQVVRMLL